MERIIGVTSVKQQLVNHSRIFNVSKYGKIHYGKIDIDSGKAESWWTGSSLPDLIKPGSQAIHCFGDLGYLDKNGIFHDEILDVKLVLLTQASKAVIHNNNFALEMMICGLWKSASENGVKAADWSQVSKSLFHNSKFHFKMMVCGLWKSVSENYVEVCESSPLNPSQHINVPSK